MGASAVHRAWDHVSIRVSDVQRSARFYIQLFGSDTARDPNRRANPGSQPGNSGSSGSGAASLALAPLAPNEAPGVDHYCLSVSAFVREAAKAALAGFDRPVPDWPSNNVWLEKS